MKKQKIIIFIGAPGSGKGTQVEKLQEQLNLLCLAPGEIFRKQIKNKTALGKKVKPFIDKGLLVDDKLVLDLIIDKIKKARKNIILDGFPRTLVQTKELHQFLLNKKDKYQVKIFELKISSKKIIKRITGRMRCEKCGFIYHLKFKPSTKKGICDICNGKLKVRPDSKPTVVKTRIKIYNKLTKPILKFYKINKFYKYYIVDALQSIEMVNKKIKSIIKL